MGGDEFMGSFECQLKDLGIFSGGDESAGLGVISFVVSFTEEIMEASKEAL